LAFTGKGVRAFGSKQKHLKWKGKRIRNLAAGSAKWYGNNHLGMSLSRKA